MGRLPRFLRSAAGLLNATVRVRAVGSLSITVDNLRCVILPASSFNDVTIAGRYTAGELLLFCAALDGNGQKLDINQEYPVEEIGGAARKWLVSDDPHNYDNVYLMVALKPNMAVA